MKILNQVENILKSSHAARNSDKELLLIYMAKYGLDLSPRQEELFRNMPSTETIRRSRQILQEQGKYPADEAVEEIRYQKFKEVQGTITADDPEVALERLGYKVMEWKS